jgi:hypothetical protein
LTLNQKRHSVHVDVGSRAIPELEAERDEVLLGFIEVRNRVETAASHKVAAE